MKPVFIEVRTKAGQDVIVNANAIAYLHFITLNPGLGLRLYFKENFYLDVNTDWAELSTAIAKAAAENNDKRP